MRQWQQRLRQHRRRVPLCLHRRIPPQPERHSLPRYTPDMELGHWVTGSMGHLGHLSRPGHWVIILTRCEIRFLPVFDKTQDEDIKIYIFVKIHSAVIEILTFNK